MSVDELVLELERRLAEQSTSGDGKHYFSDYDVENFDVDSVTLHEAKLRLENLGWIVDEHYDQSLTLSSGWPDWTIYKRGV